MNSWKIFIIKVLSGISIPTFSMWYRNCTIRNIRGSNEFLAQNIAIIKDKYKPRNFDDDGELIDIGKSIDKLYDHLNLEIGRLNCFSTSKETAEKLSSVDARITDLNLTVQKTRETLKRQQTEYITILGIFASIVLAFTGGMAFSTSVLNNIASVSAYRIIIIALLIGLILCNVVFGLFYFLGRLIKGPTSIIPFLMSNIIIIIILLGFSLLAWDNGWIEKRNVRIGSMQQQTLPQENLSNTASGEIELDERTTS